jgi:scyllo-inosamine 4-kinase
MSDFQWEQQAQIESIARDIFARYGVDFAVAKRAGGWSNATWIAGGLALRIATTQGNEKIRREAQLAALLPPEVGYPTRIDSGVTDGYEWNLSKEIPSRCLGEVWPELDWDERATALRGMWQKAQAVHSVDLAAAASLARKRAWFNSTDADEADTSLHRLTQQGLFTLLQAQVLRSALSCFWTVLPSATCVLNHGDLTLDNALWHQGQVVSLLDFEFAVIAPAEMDLNNWLKTAFGPEEVNAPLTATDRSGREKLRRVSAERARPVLAHPGGRELLLGYAILIELWLLELWLAHPEGEGPLEQWQPYRRLLSLSDGQAGYLRLLLTNG